MRAVIGAARQMRADRSESFGLVRASDYHYTSLFIFLNTILQMSEELSEVTHIDHQIQ